uniref:Non-specific serine/threonine protein kinase n=1 Tax=Heterorhabditis bacteriophora TaxID=37862 RepID=A0A1I7XAR5_HETBA
MEHILREEKYIRDQTAAVDQSLRRHELEERQERLAEKQRQLRTQFQQMQQVAPLP